MTSEDSTGNQQATTPPEAAMRAAAAPVGQSGAWSQLAGATKDGRRSWAISADAQGAPAWFMIQCVERSAQMTLRAWDDRWAFTRGSSVALTLEIAGRSWQVPQATAEGQEIRWLLAADALEMWVAALPAEGSLVLRCADRLHDAALTIPLDGGGEAAAWLLRNVRGNGGSERR